MISGRVLNLELSAGPVLVLLQKPIVWSSVVLYVIHCLALVA